MLEQWERVSMQLRLHQRYVYSAASRPCCAQVHL